MTTHTIQTSQHTHNCAPAPVQLLPRGAPAAEEPLTSRLLPLPDLQRLALLAARIAQLVELLLQSADEVGACAHSIGLGFSSMEACRVHAEKRTKDQHSAHTRAAHGITKGRP